MTGFQWAGIRFYIQLYYHMLAIVYSISFIIEKMGLSFSATALPFRFFREFTQPQIEANTSVQLDATFSIHRLLRS